MSETLTVYPIRNSRLNLRGANGTVSVAVATRALEVYDNMVGASDATKADLASCITSEELVVLLYARSFPRSEWAQRVDEAYRGLYL